MNKQERWSILGIVLGVALAASAPAQAQDRGLYLGASIGTGDSKNVCDGFVGGCDDSDTAYKLFGGYQVNRNFAWELAYGSLGDVTASGTDALGTPRSFRVTKKALDFSGIVTLPINERFAVFGRFGIYRSQVELHSTAGLQGGDHNSSFTWGLGLRFDFGPAFALRAEWQHYPDIGGSRAGVDDVDLLMAGLMMRF